MKVIQMMCGICCSVLIPVYGLKHFPFSRQSHGEARGLVELDCALLREMVDIIFG